MDLNGSGAFKLVGVCVNSYPYHYRASNNTFLSILTAIPIVIVTVEHPSETSACFRMVFAVTDQGPPRQGKIRDCDLEDAVYMISRTLAFFLSCMSNMRSICTSVPNRPVECAAVLRDEVVAWRCRAENLSRSCGKMSGLSPYPLAGGRPIAYPCRATKFRLHQDASSDIGSLKIFPPPDISSVHI